jgi:adenylate cyclase
MSEESLIRHDGNEALWYQVFAEGHPVLAAKQKRYGMLPGGPRCRLCDAPFGGIGAWIMRLSKIVASERNPNYCTACDAFLDAFPGGAEVPISMMMVDVRNSVPISASTSARDFAHMISAMRREVLDILERTDGFVLEYQGDSVFAVWPAGFVGPKHSNKAITAAEAAVRHFSHLRAAGKQVPLGIGVNTGTVYIGTVSAPGGKMSGIGAFGLEVNLLARLTAMATVGEALISAATYDAAGRTVPQGGLREETLKGIEHPVSAVHLTAEMLN